MFTNGSKLEILTFLQNEYDNFSDFTFNIRESIEQLEFILLNKNDEAIDFHLSRYSKSERCIRFLLEKNDAYIFEIIHNANVTKDRWAEPEIIKAYLNHIHNTNYFSTTLLGQYFSNVLNHWYEDYSWRSFGIDMFTANGILSKLDEQLFWGLFSLIVNHKNFIEFQNNQGYVDMTNYPDHGPNKAFFFYFWQYINQIEMNEYSINAIANLGRMIYQNQFYGIDCQPYDNIEKMINKLKSFDTRFHVYENYDYYATGDETYLLGQSAYLYEDKINSPFFCVYAFMAFNDGYYPNSEHDGVRAYSYSRVRISKLKELYNVTDYKTYRVMLEGFEDNIFYSFFRLNPYISSIDWIIWYWNAYGVSHEYSNPPAYFLNENQLEQQMKKILSEFFTDIYNNKINMINIGGEEISKIQASQNILLFYINKIKNQTVKDEYKKLYFDLLLIDKNKLENENIYKNFKVLNEQNIQLFNVSQQNKEKLIIIAVIIILLILIGNYGWIIGSISFIIISILLTIILQKYYV